MYTPYTKGSPAALTGQAENMPGAEDAETGSEAGEENIKHNTDMELNWHFAGLEPALKPATAAEFTYVSMACKFSGAIILPPPEKA